MKGFKKWSPACLSVVLIVGVVAGWMVVHQITSSEAQTPGSPKAPGLQAKLLPPKLPASPTPPPGEDIGPPPDQASRQRPTRESLLEKMRQMPGGPEMLEEAKRRGARIGMGPVESESSLSWLNLFEVKEAEATGTFSLTLDPSNTWYSSSPFGSVSFYGAAAGASYSSTTSVRLYVVSSTLTGTQVTQPSLSFTFKAPSDDWYIVNIEAWWINIANATLKHYEGGAYPVVKTWDYGGKTGPTQSYPALLELTAGNHSFYWLPSSSVYVYEVDVYSI